MLFKNAASLGLSAVLMSALVGCGQSAERDAKAPEKESNAAVETAANDGWWCVEHGIPEGICAQCSTKVAADYKNKGDWCEAHDRPESQCFICHPELEAKFAAQYEARYGKKPPKPEAENAGERQEPQS